LAPFNPASQIKISKQEISRNVKVTTVRDFSEGTISRLISNLKCGFSILFGSTANVIEGYRTASGENNVEKNKKAKSHAVFPLRCDYQLPGVGTLKAMPVNFPLSSGITFPTACSSNR
jgi:hypothetical protein